MGPQPNSRINLADAVNQKARRRRETLFKKASEYCSECEADIYLILRMKKTGRIYTLASESKGWPLSQKQLVSFASVTWIRLCKSTNYFTSRGSIILFQSGSVWIARGRRWRTDRLSRNLEFWWRGNDPCATSGAFYTIPSACHAFVDYTAHTSR